jgi:rubrerythrin
MPEFTNPFIGVVPGRKLTDSELLRALRLNLSAEEEAVHLYLSHADATDNGLAKKVLQDIADEERVHKGEFQRLINLLSKEEESLLAQSAEEVNAVAAGRAPPDEAGEPATSTKRTISIRHHRERCAVGQSAGGDLRPQVAWASRP